MTNKNKIDLGKKINRRLKILFCAAEASPLAKVGGLGDVVGSLPKALGKMGLDATLILPFYASLKNSRVKLVKKNLPIELDASQDIFDLYQTILPGSKTIVYLIKHKFFDYPEIYFGNKKIKVNKQTIGDIERYTFFSKAIVEVIRSMNWSIDIVHCHDWHTALVPSFIDEHSVKYQNFPNIKTLLTIHNLANQGIATLDILDYAGLHHDLTPAVMEDYYDQDGQILDLLKIGILSADYINTVSPSYAKEILTKEHGDNLEKYLWRRHKNLSGILNGIDVDFFDPNQDKLIYKKYNYKNFAIGKKVNKQKLQKYFKLDIDASAPMLGLVTRLFKQKGLDILLPTIEDFLKKENFQLVVLGSGQAEYEQALKNLQKQYPKRLAIKIGFDVSLAQKIYAASDFFLMPSFFEPCGLGQMIAMRYGSIPIVRATGGLKDTVSTKTGFIFSAYQQEKLASTIKKAFQLYSKPVQFNKMIKHDMQLDFSWKKSAQQYVSLYNKLLK